MSAPAAAVYHHLFMQYLLPPFTTHPAVGLCSLFQVCSLPPSVLKISSSSAC
jgi:hypothetical protein